MSNNHTVSSLDDLSVFQAVSRAGGFRAAARRLGVSPSTVSETISRLEQQIGTPLFTRTTRSVHLTEAGQLLAERCECILSDAQSAIREASGSVGEVSGRLKLNVPGAVMIDILPHIIDGFLTRHKDVRVEIMVDDRLVDVVAEGCDAGIRYGEHLAQDMISVPIGPRRQAAALAASPEYLARNGVPAHPEDLLRHDCIRVRFSSGALMEWEFERRGDILIVDPPGKLIVTANSSSAITDFARNGHGLVYLFRNWLDPYFDSGRLVPVLEDWWCEFEGPRLYYPSRFMPRALRAFIDFVAEQRSGTGMSGMTNRPL